MWEAFFGFKKTPFSDRPEAKQLFASEAWNQVRARLEFLAQHHGVGLLTGEVGSGKSTAARAFAATLNPNLYKILYVHFSSGSALDLLRQIARELDLEPAHRRGDLVRQTAEAVLRLNQSKKQHPILICDEAHLLPHPALVELPLLLNFDMDSSRCLTLLLLGQTLLRRTLSLQRHEALRQRISVHYHLEGITREELDAYLAQQLKAAGVSQPLFDDSARQALYQATKGIPRKVNKVALTALRLAAARKAQTVDNALLVANLALALGAAADQNLLVDTRAAGHLLSAPEGWRHFLEAAHEAAAEVIVLDPLYSTHDQDENGAPSGPAPWRRSARACSGCARPRGRP